MKSPALDQLSTSQKEIASLSPVFCIYHAPFFAYTNTGKRYFVVQGCCNHWDCPRCGELRAKAEYGRIVNGAHVLSENHDKFYFITITCRGKEISRDEATKGYLLWTNRLLSTCRARAKTQKSHWYYAAVTERQKRGHPHSHILTTFCPSDVRTEKTFKWKAVRGERAYVEVDILRSDWFEKKCVAAGLGNQYDISLVQEVEKVSRYIAKYMFKKTAFSGDWPRGWKRVRYSRSYPKLPERSSAAFVLMKSSDWQKLASLASIITCQDKATYERTNAVMRHYFYGKIKLVTKAQAK